VNNTPELQTERYDSGAGIISKGAVRCTIISKVFQRGS